MKTNLLMLFIATFTIFSCSSNTENSSEEEVIEVVEEVVEETHQEIQVLEPVKWEYTTEKVSENEYTITFNAAIDPHWYVYSTNIEGMGPIPTTFYYDDSTAITAFSEVSENGEVTKDGYDEMFDLNIKKFAKAATFSQTITTSGPATITGYLEFMTCDSVQCLFPDPIEFEVEVK